MTNPPKLPDLDNDASLTQLIYYLFGNPFDAKDLGVIGRMEQRVDIAMQRVDRLIRLGWALMLVLITSILTLLVDIIVNVASQTHRL